MSKILRLLETEYLPLTDIRVGSRIRRVTADVKDHIEQLAESIKNLGPIMPILIDENNNLIDGGCRYSAYELLGELEVPVVRRDKITPDDLRMLEVEANLRRKEMKWQEVAIGIYMVHKRKTEDTAKRNKANKARDQWGTRATGSLMRVSHAHVADCLIVAEYLYRGDKEILDAPSMETAQKILLSRKENAAVAAKAALSASSFAVTPAPRATRASGIISLTLGPDSPATPTTPSPTQSPATTLASHHVDLSTSLFNVDCRDFMLNHMTPESVDLIVTDIPYGIDMALMEDLGGLSDDIKDAHEVEDNIEQMSDFLRGAYRVLKPNTYLCFFYALQHHEKLRNWGIEAGFSVQDWPLLWLKPHSSKNQAPHCNWTKSYEPCFIMRKGKPTIKPMTKSHLEVDGLPDKKLQSNPFAKPLEWLNAMIFDPIAYPGMTVLDPYAGEGSILRAAIVRGCRIIACEKSPSRFPRLVDRIKTVYKNAMGDTTTFTIPEYK